MIDLVRNRVPRGVLFMAFNAIAGLFLLLFVVSPVVSHFASRSEDISENAAQLVHFQGVIRNAKALMQRTPQTGDPFLAGNEERVVSADLQATLKAIVAASDVRFLSIRAVQGKRSQPLRMVAASVELEGPLPAVRDVILAIENKVPLLFVTAASLRSAADGDESLIRAELKVQGAMHDSGSLAGAAGAIPQ